MLTGTDPSAPTSRLSGHVLIVRADGMGDVLLAGPAVRAIKASAQRVTFMAGPRGVGAARLLPGVDEVVMEHLSWIDSEAAPMSRAAADVLIERVRRLAPSTAVILTSYHQSPLPAALLLRLAGVPRIAAISVEYPGTLLDLRHRVDDDLHEAQRGLSLAAAAGFRLPPGDRGELRVALPARTPSPPAELADGAPYVVVHPGASVPARAWSPAANAGVVRLLARAGWTVAVTGSAREESLTAHVAGASGLDLGGRLDLPGLAHVLRGAAAVIVGNTGPAHLAAAVGRPIVSLYAPTVPAMRWRPWKVPHALLGHQDIGCAGCRARQCPVPGHPCVDTVGPAAVLEAFHHLAGSEPGELLVGRRR